MRLSTLFMMMLSLILIQAAHAASLVWEVSNNGQHYFIAADRPFYQKADFRIPDEYARALGSADVFVSAAKWGYPKSASEQLKNEKSMFYPAGQLIWSALDRETAERLLAFVKSHHLDLVGVDGFKPGMMVLAISQVGYLKLDYTPSMQDKLMLQALTAGKLPGRIGSPEERLDYWLELEEGPFIDLIKYKLDFFAGLPDRLEAMETALASGDEASISKALLDHYRKNYPAAYDYEIGRTVKDLLSHLENWPRENRIDFILLDIRYLVGKDGVLEQLRRQGMTVKQL